jgi:hypothetical protein
MFCSLWFTAYQQDKPLVKLLQSLNAARKQAIASSPDFLTTAVRLLLLEYPTYIQFHDNRCNFMQSKITA